MRVIQGPRQSGKTSFLEKKVGANNISRLDDLHERELANRDPALFLSLRDRRPLVIDEAHYAPNLFPQLKLEVDLARRARRESVDPGMGIPPLFFVTGSNQTLLAREVRESLAGRATYYRLHTLSLREIVRAKPDYRVFDYLLRGGWPELSVDPTLSASRFLDDYVTSFLEKDIARAAGIEKLRAFETALGLLAARTGQQLNLSEVAGQAGVDGSTLSGWVSVLEQNGIVALVPSFSSNLSKRLVKTPKLYFLEPSLAARLQGWTELDPLLKSPQAGGMFETMVHAEIVRTIDHCGVSAKGYYLRTREGDEVDFLLEGANSRRVLIEAKFSIQSVEPVKLSSELRKVVARDTPALVVVPSGEPLRLSETCWRIPVTQLADQLISLAQSTARK